MHPLNLILLLAPAVVHGYMKINQNPRPCLFPDAHNVSTSACARLYSTPTCDDDDAGLVASFRPDCVETCIPLRHPIHAIAIHGTSWAVANCQVFVDQRCRRSRGWTKAVLGYDSKCMDWDVKGPEGIGSIKCFYDGAE